jgi:DNA adenine methylase
VILSPVTRPVLRYYGGKWKLAPWIISHFPEHRVYVEPFGGAGSVLMRKPRAYAEIYNDLDGEIVNLFHVLRDPIQGAELIRQLRLTPFAREEYALSYQVDPDPVEQARRTVARAYMGFGTNSINRSIATGFRANSNRTNTTPAHDWAHFPDCLNAIVDRLAGVVIENRDAQEVIRQQDSPETLIYADPPYVHSTRGRAQRGNYFAEMTDGDHRELSSLLHQVRGIVVLSGYRCDLYDELYADWQRFDKSTTADGARPRVESLWISRVRTQLVMQFSEEAIS